MKRTNYACLILESTLLCFLILNSSLWSTQAQSLPPANLDGFVYQNYGVDFDTIIIEAFFDPVCPDSRDAWPPLKQAIEYYGPRLSFVLHLLPLPYHDNAYATSRALHIVNIHNSSSTFCLLEQFFKHQLIKNLLFTVDLKEKFYNTATQNLSRTSVVNEIVKFSAETLGKSYFSALQSGFSDRKTDLLTRVSFKYSTSKGVFATPTFYVNGFVLSNAGSPLDYKGWRKVIDPLVDEKA